MRKLLQFFGLSCETYDKRTSTDAWLFTKLQQIAFRLFTNHQEAFVYGTRSTIDFDVEFIAVCVLDHRELN